MTRRASYSKVKKTNQIRTNHVKGMGDVVFKGFQCLNPECENFIFIRTDDISEDFEIECSTCGYKIYSGGETSFYDYEMIVNVEGHDEIKSKGSFSVLHEDYIEEALEYKYCIICNTMKPLNFFDKHSVRKSLRQGECRLCKKTYNDIKNGTRLTDQHREASQKRRLYLDISGGSKINSRKIYERFSYKCFNCGKDLSSVSSAKERPLDHTLPVYYLWPLTNETATLLCRKCNGDKSGCWPSQFYGSDKLKELAVITGLPFELISGPPVYNPKAIEKLMETNVVDNLLTKYSAYFQEIIKIRNRILKDIGFDFFKVSKKINEKWIELANSQLT